MEVSFHSIILALFFYLHSKLTLCFTSTGRDLCMRTYVSPQLPPNESALDIVDLHSNDWRRCYIEQ